MKKLLLFAALLLPTAHTLAAASALPALAKAQAEAQAQAPAEADAAALLLAFIARQPHDIALSVQPVQEGQPLGKPLLEWNASQPMPLASSMKIVVLAAYAEAVASGELDPQQPVTLREWDSFFVLQDGGAHKAALLDLDIRTDYFGRANVSSRTVPLDALARAMLMYSDNAATDVLMTRLGRGRIDAAVQRLGLEGQEPLAPISGIFTAWNGKDAGRLPTLSPQQRANAYWAEAQRVASDLDLSNPWKLLPTLLKNAGSEMYTNLENQTFPAGTTADYSRVMAGVLGADTGQFSAQELTVMRRHLGWLREVSPENAGVYSALYLKGGSMSTVLTQNYALTPKVGPHAGQSVAVSLFIRNIPAEKNEALQASLNQVMLRLAFDAEAQARMAAALQQTAVE